MSEKRIHALELGGTLFVPASHRNLDPVLSGEKYPELRSVVIDFEDGLANKDRSKAIVQLKRTLSKLEKTRLLRFTRAQDPQMLETLLQQKEIGKLDGFILPKFGLDNADAYLSLMASTNHSFMPSIEGSELFETQKLQQLRDLLLPYKERIICIRFGAQDMLRQLGLRQTGSIYDMLAPQQIIANLITLFKPAGFEISAPVYPGFSDMEGFQKEIQRELQNGLTSKTIIHPTQIEPINDLYKVTQKELEEAKIILTQHDGVLNMDGIMGEVKTQSPWAEQILKRARIYDLF